MIRRRPVAIANEIRLKRSLHEGVFLVVEGRDDRLFCERFVHPTCKIVVAEGKENVCEVVRILDEDCFAGVVGVVDADFDRIIGSGSRGSNLATMDTHDLEAYLIRSPALDRVLVELGSKGKLEALGGDVRDLLISAALPLGLLRLHSHKQGLGLRFAGLNYAACVDPASLRVDLVRVVEEVKNRSQRPELRTDVLTEAIEDERRRAKDPWEVCSGEDLVEILSIGLRRCLGSRSASEARGELLRRALRLSLDEADFERACLSRTLREWESRNPPFRVLR